MIQKRKKMIGLRNRLIQKSDSIDWKCVDFSLLYMKRDDYS